MRTIDFPSEDGQPRVNGQNKAGGIALAIMLHAALLYGALQLMPSRLVEASAANASNTALEFFQNLLQGQKAREGKAAALSPDAMPLPASLEPPRFIPPVVAINAQPDTPRPATRQAASEQPAQAAPGLVQASAAPAAREIAVPAPPTARASIGAIDAPREIRMLSKGSSKASYAFPGMSAEELAAPPTIYEVDIGTYPDIELAVVNHVISLIRSKYPDSIMWDSHVRNAMVRLSMRSADHAELEKFLRLEFYGAKAARFTELSATAR